MAQSVFMAHARRKLDHFDDLTELRIEGSVHRSIEGVRAAEDPPGCSWSPNPGNGDSPPTALPGGLLAPISLPESPVSGGSRD